MLYSHPSAQIPVTRTLLVALSIFVAACSGQRTPQYHQKLVVLGLDGLDPDLVSRFIDEGKLPNMQKLAKLGALQRLETTPSPDASAWASFATGTNPGKHGIFATAPQMARHGSAFWTLAGQAGVRTSVLTVPLTFPPELIPNGELLSGWPTPDLRETSGTYSYFATDVSQADDGSERSGGLRRRLVFDGDVARTVFAGPRGLTVPVSIFWNRAGKTATIDIGGTSVRLDEGEWSKWINVDFRVSLLNRHHGMIAVFLVRASSSFALYVSPINSKPDRPMFPLSAPLSLSADLYERLGAYRTLGWAEPTAALDAGVIDDKAFVDDVYRALDDRAQVILQRADTHTWDLLVGEIDSIDRVQHVMWGEMGFAKFGDVIERAYRRCDEVIGELVTRVGPGTPVIVMSVYGGHGFTRTFDLNRWLAQEGLAGKASATNSGGITLTPGARSVEDHLIARLTALLDPATQMPFVRAVYKRAAIYAGPYAEMAPDLQVGMAPGYRVGDTPGMLAGTPGRWSAEHASLDYKSVSGTLVSSRPTSTDNPRVIDIAPTVLRYFGLPIPTEIDGTPLY